MSEQEPQAKEEVVDGVEDYSDTEIQAMEHGWNPEGIEGKKNLTADEFLDRQPLYDDIRSLKKQTRKLQDGIEAMKSMQDGIRARERDKTIRELQASKKVALENENYDAVLEIDEYIAQTRSEPLGPKTNVVFEQWVDKNEWYHDSPDMRQYADMIGAAIYQKNPNRPINEVYAEVGKEVKARFPDKFGNANRDRPNPVEGAGKGRAGRTSSKHSARDLPEDDRKIMETIVRSGAMTKDEYLKEYFA